MTTTTWTTLSIADSKVETHSCSRPGTNGCRACRWFEVELFSRPREDGRTDYRVSLVGRSIVPGETNRYRTEVSTSPHAIIDFLAMGEPGRRYIPKVSRKVLHESGDVDSALADALDDFDTVTAS